MSPGIQLSGQRTTTEEIRQLIVYSHSIGVDFYLGSGVFAWFGLDALANAHPETKAVGATVNYRGGGMCPSNPLSRKLNMDYLMEMYDTFPDADGMFLEIRDEYGPCECISAKRRNLPGERTTPWPS